MKETGISIDRKKHILYSKRVKNVITARLTADYGAKEAVRLWEKTRQVYAGFLKEMPFIGGKKNPQARGVYDSIALLAYYEAVPDKPSLEAFEQVCNEAFVSVMESVGFVNMNWPWVLRLEQLIFRSIEKKSRKYQEQWVGNYHMKVSPYDKEKGIRYEFTTCPVADFAKRHGYTHLMPALCNPDYPMMEAMHGSLIRRTTLANGSRCDYWIVGDKSPYLEKHPRKKDADGYWYNQ